MSYKKEQLPDITTIIQTVTEVSDLNRTDWRRQTDAIKLQFSAAQLVCENVKMACLVDGRITVKLIRDSLESKGGGKVKQFFNQRCHDYGLTCRRIIVLDTKSTKGMGGQAKNGRANMHFHGVFLIPEGENRTWLRQKLLKVFGNARALNTHQFKYGLTDNEKHYTFAGKQGFGIAGKMNYIFDHAGSTHAALELNDDHKRSRKAPACRRECNKLSKGLAAGIPSNFLAKIVICDTKSKQAGKAAFEDWVKAATPSDKYTYSNIANLEAA